MKKKINNRGITLITLIVTIIILLILAGVVINVLIGDNGLFNTVQTAKEKTAVAELKEKADIEYASLKIEDIEKEIKLSQIIEKLKQQGYTIVTTNNGGSEITGITLNPETFILAIGETKDIEVTVKREETAGTKYYANIYDAYYEIKLQNGEIKIRRKSKKYRKRRNTRKYDNNKSRRNKHRSRRNKHRSRSK